MIGLILLISSASAYVCKFRLPDNHIMDLGPLRRTDDYTVTASDGFTYYANVCRDAGHSCSTGANGVATQWEDSRCTATLGRGNLYNEAYEPPKVSYIDEALPDAGVILTYHNGDACKGADSAVEYWLHCDESETGLLYSAEESSPCVYKLEFLTKSACKRQARSSAVLYWLIGFFISSLLLCAYSIWDECDGCCLDVFSKASSKVAQMERSVSQRGAYETV
jgi:hypothetical protein